MAGCNKQDWPTKLLILIFHKVYVKIKIKLSDQSWFLVLNWDSWNLLLFTKLTMNSNILYKLKRCSKIECCKQSRYVKFKGTMTKWPVQKSNTQNNTKTRGSKGPWVVHLRKMKRSQWSHLQRTTNVVHQILVEDL